MTKKNIKIRHEKTFGSQIITVGRPNPKLKAIETLNTELWTTGLVIPSVTKQRVV